MDDDTETVDEPAAETEVAPDPPAAPDPVVEQPAEVAGEQPESTRVGHMIEQDNVTEPGRQVTRTPEGEVTSATEADPF